MIFSYHYIVNLASADDEIREKSRWGWRLSGHSHIGQEKIGLEAFLQIIRRFLVSKVLETSKEDDMDMSNLEVLKELL